MCFKSSIKTSERPFGAVCPLVTLLSHCWSQDRAMPRISRHCWSQLGTGVTHDHLSSCSSPNQKNESCHENMTLSFQKTHENMTLPTPRNALFVGP